jgi:hypothetical protein
MEWQHTVAEPVKTESPFEGQQFLAPQFNRHREGPQKSAALPLSKPPKCGSWAIYNAIYHNGGYAPARLFI